jgi:hypothetical protein
MEEELTISLDSGTTRRMGRPPLSKKSVTKPTLVRLTEDVAARIDALAGPNKRAEFIRDAIDREIKRRERIT